MLKQSCNLKWPNNCPRKGLEFLPKFRRTRRRWGGGSKTFKKNCRIGIFGHPFNTSLPTNHFAIIIDLIFVEIFNLK